jgi:hypothetical protein
MAAEPPELGAARDVTAQVAAALRAAPAFQAMDPGAQAELLGDLSRIQDAVGARDPYALALETPAERMRRRAGFGAQPAPDQNGAPAPATSAPRPPATETLAARAGALADEIDFPAFVAGLVHGTFDAIVDATIRQMEAFASLVSAVARDVDAFTRENVSDSQARLWLAQQHPQDLAVDRPTAPGQEPVLQIRRGEDDEPPAWLEDYGLGDQALTGEVVEEELVPAARRSLGESRLKTLATMVLLGMNRVVVRDGRIAARVRFRATARDNVAVDYSVSQDPGGSGWGSRGSGLYDSHQTMISTVGVNAQADTDLRVELFGQVELNFASETVPLDRFVDTARMALLQRNARWSGPDGAPAATPVPAGPAPAPEPAPAPAPEGT